MSLDSAFKWARMYSILYIGLSIRLVVFGLTLLDCHDYKAENYENIRQLIIGLVLPSSCHKLLNIIPTPP
jgi:hypothetical protein